MLLLTMTHDDGVALAQTPLCGVVVYANGIRTYTNGMRYAGVNTGQCGRVLLNTGKGLRL